MLRCGIAHRQGRYETVCEQRDQAYSPKYELLSTLLHTVSWYKVKHKRVLPDTSPNIWLIAKSVSSQSGDIISPVKSVSEMQHQAFTELDDVPINFVRCFFTIFCTSALSWPSTPYGGNPGTWELESCSTNEYLCCKETRSNLLMQWPCQNSSSFWLERHRDHWMKGRGIRHIP
jgi:hypothetical protein